MHKGRMRWAAAAVTTTGVVAAGGAVVWADGGAWPGGGGGGSRAAADRSASMLVSPADSGAAERYWTARRMAAATPLGDRRAARGVTAQAVPPSTAFAGVPAIGALFFNNGKGDHYCTASVVQSGSQRLLLTAAHCIHGGKGRSYATKVAFVPKYDQGRRPYGTWTAGVLLVDRRWAAQSDADLDFGFIVLNRRNGRTIQSVAGANRLVINQGVGKWVNVSGYPKITYDRRDRPIYCRTKTARQSRFQIRMDCAGFYGGTSGSPWLLNFNSGTKRGDVNGVVGGYQGGGSTASRSYSPYFDGDIAALRTAADRKAG